MRRWWTGVALVLAACAPGPPPPPGTAQALFIAPDAIQVVASDFVPARTVSLVGPAGEVPAVSIDTTRNSAFAGQPSGGAFSVGVGAGGRGSFGGIGLGFPLGGGGPATLPVAVSTALIRLPAEPPYAELWPRSQIRIELGDPPAVKTISIPAPPPRT